MAVFTTLEKKEIENFLKEFSIGNLLSYEGIAEGIENTNYKISTNQQEYILTIFEKRVNPADLPFFIKLQKALASQGFDCPLPIENNIGKNIGTIKRKSAVIISFLNGKQLQSILPRHCREVGSIISKFTNITKSSKLMRKNSMNIDAWENIFKKCKENSTGFYDSYLEILEKELFFLKKNWPKNLPEAIIHADLFPDNIFL